MSYVLPQLKTKKGVDEAIKGSEDKVVVLRFGREQDAVCLQLDDIVRPLLLKLISTNSLLHMLPTNAQLAKNQHLVSRMAELFIVEVDSVPVYTQYFDITLIPATIFFFNGQHMKVDWGCVSNL